MCVCMPCVMYLMLCQAHRKGCGESPARSLSRDRQGTWEVTWVWISSVWDVHTQWEAQRRDVEELQVAGGVRAGRGLGWKELRPRLRS